MCNARWIPAQRPHTACRATNNRHRTAASHHLKIREFGRSERIRTSDPLLPKQVRYQTALRSDRARGVTLSRGSLQEGAAHQFKTISGVARLLRPRMNRPAAMIMAMPSSIIGDMPSPKISQPKAAAQMICEYCIGATMIAGALR